MWVHLTPRQWHRHHITWLDVESEVMNDATLLMTETVATINKAVPTYHSRLRPWKLKNTEKMCIILVGKHLLWRIVYGCPATIIKMRSFKKGKTCIKGCLAQSFQFRWLWSCEAYFVLLVWHTIIQNNYKYLTLFCCLRFNVASVRSSSLCCLLYDIFYQTEQSGIHIVSCKTWASAAVDVLQNFVNPRQLLSHTWCA